MKIYEVGGCVRDRILGITPCDIDYVIVGTTIEYIENHFEDFERVGASFPVFLHVNNEYALARDENSFSPNTTIETDLFHRDFTINAMAYDTEQDLLIDPYGGKSDIENKIIRMVNPNAIKIDPIRAIRAARFAARYDFSIDDKIIDAVVEIKSDDIDPDRVWREFDKVLQTEYFDKFINNLVAIGMDVKLKFNRVNEFTCVSGLGLTTYQKYKRFMISHDTTKFICKTPNHYVNYGNLYYDLTSSESIHKFIVASKNYLDIHDYIEIYDPEHSKMLQHIRDNFDSFEIDMSLEGKERGLKLKSQRLEMIEQSLKDFLYERN